MDGAKEIGFKSKNKCLLSPHSQTCENCRFFGLECTFLREKKKRYDPGMAPVCGGVLTL